MTQNFSQGGAFPVRSKQLNIEIEDIDTDILLCAYSDYVMVAVTHTESLGTIYQSRADTNLDGATSFNIKVLVGNRTDVLLMLCARQLAEGLSAAGCSKPLMLCLGLRDLSLQKVRQIVHHVVQHPVW